MNWLVNNMANVIDMRDFDCLFDNLEEYFNKHGYTLGNDADRLQELMHCIQYCYIHGVATGSQIESMKKKFRKQVSGSLKELDNVKNTLTVNAGLTSGKIMCLSLCQALAPSIVAASKRSFDIF